MIKLTNLNDEILFSAPKIFKDTTWVWCGGREYKVVLSRRKREC